MDPDDYYSDEEWYADQVAAADSQGYYSDEEWFADQTAGLEDLGNGNYYDPTDGGVYLGDSQEWVYPDQGFVDPVSGTEIQSDGTLIFANGDQLNTDGSWILSDGSVLQTGDDGITTYRDAEGVVWERMDYAGAPNAWQNTQNGDVFNEKDGTLVTAEQVAGGYSSGAPTGSSRPTSNTGGGGPSAGGSGASGGLSGGGKQPSLEDLLKLLVSMNGQQQQLAAAKGAGASTAQLAQLQAQLAAAARSAAPAVTSTGGVNQFLKDNATILIAGGLAAVLLLSRRPAPTYVYEKPAA